MRLPLALRSSATRLAILYVLAFAIAAGLLLWSVFLITQRLLVREFDLVIQTDLRGLKEHYDGEGLGALTAALNRRSDSWGRTGAVYLLVDPQFKRIAGNLSGWPPVQRPVDDAAPGEWLEFDIVARERNENVDHPVRAEIVQLDGGRRLMVGTDITESRNFVQQFRNAILWAIALTVLLCMIIGVWYSRGLNRRVRAVALACEKIISGDLSRRLDHDGSNDELDQLSSIVNLMLDRIEQQTVVLRTTFDSTAHDLRAPLHRVRMRIEETLRQPNLRTDSRSVLNDTLADVERVQRTLVTLLQIAQAEAGAPLAARERVDLTQLVDEMRDLYAPEAKRRGLTLEARSEPNVTVRGSRQLLAQSIANLLENALNYAPGQGSIEVRLSVENGQRVVLEVADDGPGIPESDRATVLQPFRRLERAPVGGAGLEQSSGLGLSLVAAVVRLHRGRLVLTDNSPGLIVRCEFETFRN
ncbi:MAG: HAMP domain-containing sensor histidine kinase [Steroidobacteraceae bacterium]